MKKLFIILTALLLSLLLALTGCNCSCATEGDLSFNQNFAGNGTDFELLGSTYTETLSYKVEYDDNYYSYITKGATVANDQIPTYSNGKYVTSFRANAALPDGVKTDISFTGGELHHLKTELSIDVTASNGKTYNDKVISECYFYSIGFSYTPVYVIQTVKNTLFSFDQSKQKLVPSVAVNQYETVYKSTSYVLTKKTLTTSNAQSLELADASELHTLKTGLKVINSTSYNYQPKKLVDNTELYFVMRNMDLAINAKASLPTVAPVFGQVKTLSIKNVAKKTRTFEITYNGTSSSYEIPVNHYSFALSDNINTGVPQYAVYQSNQASNLSFKAFPVEIVQPIIEYSSYSTLGVLIYTLQEIKL